VLLRHIGFQFEQGRISLKPEKFVSAEEWRGAHETFLAREKAMTDALDQLAAQRRRTAAGAT